jgi:[protein-PII] uridylyltransferase
VTVPARQDGVGVSVLTGTRTDRFALALDGFFNTVPLAGLLTGERDGTGDRQQLLRLLRDFVEGERQAILKEHRQGARGIEVVKELTDLADVVIKELYRRSEEVCRGTSQVALPCALLALGGYGRRELNPASDVDLMFLHTSPIHRSVYTLIHFLIPLLWDVGFNVGHSVRSLQDCARMAAEDLSSHTSMLEARLLAGDKGLFDQMETVLRGGLKRKRGAAYVKAKLQERAARYAKHGDSVYMQEPHIKEGAGGLRDLHTALWIARVRHPVSRLEDLGDIGLLSQEELHQLRHAVDFLHRIRNELHYLSGRKNDLLLFHLQEPAAAHLGFGDDRAVLGVERCMQHYYLQARTISHLSERVIERCTEPRAPKESLMTRLRARDLGDGLTEINREIHILPRNRRLFEDDPIRLLKIFWYALQTGYPLSSAAQQIIREHLHLIDDKFRQSSRALNFFLAILRERKGVAAALRLMHDLGVLGAYIPEFAEITCLVQYDLYHKYTVDVHTLLALEHMESLDQAPAHYAEEFRAIVAEMKRPELLKLGVLFHDIGKGEGRGHEARGAEITRQILTRMGLPDADVAEVRFLVEHHLAMAHISQRRDLDDEAMLVEFARTVRDIERLKMLYLLTYLDIRAVAPEVWTEWKGTLLWELYIRTHTLLTRGIPEGVDELAKAAEIKERLLHELREEFPLPIIETHLEQVPVRYLLGVPSAKVAAHLRLVARIAEGEEAALQWTPYPLVGHSEVTVCAFGRPGRFAQIVGTLTANRMNILGAQIFTRRDGLVLRTFQVDDGKGAAITDAAVWRSFQADLGHVLAGQADVGQLILNRQREILSRPARKGGTPPPTRVEFDNYVSETHTVIDVRTHDRLGLLYIISKVLLDLGLDLSLAKITTEVEQVVDVFYVTERDGGKVGDQRRLDEIRERLEGAIARGLLDESRGQS